MVYGSGGQLAGALSTVAQPNITSLGTLTSLTISGDVAIDTNTLKVDASTNRVGILNASPDVSLDVGSATDAIHVPSGNTAQRPTGANGYFRYNSEDAQFEGYADGAWGAIAGGGGGSAMETNNFTGDGSAAAFTLSSSVASEDNLIAFIEGVYQNKSDFVASGTTITFGTAPVNGRSIVVYHVKASISGSSVIQNAFTGDGSDTTFTLSVAPQSENNTQVYLDGVYQNKSSYSVSGTTLTFDAAPANTVAIEVIMFAQTSINEPAANTVGITQLNVSDGSSGQVLSTDGSGTLSFATVSGTTINNNADNRIITGSGTANTLEGEATLNYIGNNILMSGGTDARIVFGTGGAGAAISNDANWVRGEADSLIYNAADNGSHKYEINGIEKMRIDTTGVRGSLTNGSRATQDTFAIGLSDVIQPNLLLYFNVANSNSYSGSGTTVTDLSGNSNTCYLGAGVGYSTSNGGYFTFAGNESSSTSFIGTPVVLPTNDRVTYMYWVYYNDADMNDLADYQLNGIQTGSGYCYVGREPGYAASVYGYIGAGTAISNANSPGNGQQWEHVAITRDSGSSGYGKQTIYINGEVSVSNLGLAATAHTATFNFGGVTGASNGSGNASYTLNGRIASGCIYDRALSQAEIIHNMMVDAPRLWGI